MTRHNSVFVRQTAWLTRSDAFSGQSVGLSRRELSEVKVTSTCMTVGFPFLLTTRLDLYRSKGTCGTISTAGAACILRKGGPPSDGKVVVLAAEGMECLI